MSRFRRFATRSQKRNSATLRRKGPVFRAWHMVCTFLPLTACPYLGPIGFLEENMPPEIVHATPGDTITVASSAHKVFVVADDPDGDEIVFLWSLSESGLIGDAVPSGPPFQGSQIELTHDETLDGQVVTCTFSDGFSEYQTKSWTVEVL